MTSEDAMKQAEAIQLDESCGFDHAGIFDVAGLKFLSEVRDMCEANKCGLYGRRWTCPPAIDTLEEIRAKAQTHEWGIVLQTTAEMEDEFDGETMLEAQETQIDRFNAYCDKLREVAADCLPMSSGNCTNRCKVCTYPFGECRFPQYAYPSMEAYGLLVSEVCKLADTPYYYGRSTVTFTSCVLF